MKIGLLLFGSESVTASPPPPPGAPQEVICFTYSGTKKGLEWTDAPGDEDASHDVSVDSGASVLGTRPPGSTTWASGGTTCLGLAVRHNRSGNVSAWVGFL